MNQGYNQAMDQIHLSQEAEQRIVTALETQSKRPAKRNWRVAAALAAAAVLMTGSAFAVAYRAGVLDVFFHGDTSQLEPYVQTAVASAENQDYRLTVESSVCDSQSLYAVITVEGRNDQAVADLNSNKVIAESHRAVWGQEMVDSLMASGSAGPETFWAAFADSGVSTSGIQYQSLPAPSDTSRSWRVKISRMDADHQMDSGSILFWLGFMGKEYAVEIPTDTAMETIQLSIDRDVQPQYPDGPMVFVQSLELSPVSLSYVGTYWDAQRDDNNSPLIFFRMKDGQIATQMQVGYHLNGAGKTRNRTDCIRCGIRPTPRWTWTKWPPSFWGIWNSPWTAPTPSLPMCQRISIPSSVRRSFRGKTSSSASRWRSCVKSWGRTIGGTRPHRPPPPSTAGSLSP